MERQKAIRVPLLAIWGEEEWTLGIEPLWQELMGSLPLTRVVMETTFHHEVELDPLLEFDATNLAVTDSFHVGGCLSRWEHPHCFVLHHRAKAEIVVALRRDEPLHLLGLGELGNLAVLQHLLSQVVVVLLPYAGHAFLVLDEVVECVLSG